MTTTVGQGRESYPKPRPSRPKTSHVTLAPCHASVKSSWRKNREPANVDFLRKWTTILIWCHRSTRTIKACLLLLQVSCSHITRNHQATTGLSLLFCITLCLRGVEHCQHTGYILRVIIIWSHKTETSSTGMERL